MSNECKDGKCKSKGDVWTAMCGKHEAEWAQHHREAAAARAVMLADPEDIFHPLRGIEHG